MRDALIVSSVRTPVGKAFKGAFRAMRPDDLAAIAIRGAIDRVPGLDAAAIDDVIIGCAMPEGEQGMNVARIASLRAGLPVEVSAMTVNRFCSSGLQAIAMGAERVMLGSAEVVLAGGTESMSMVPMAGNKMSPNPWLMDHYPDSYLAMGLTAENLARKYAISRQQSDEFSYSSHQKALAAISSGKFKDEVLPVEVRTSIVSNGDGRPARLKVATAVIDTDEGPRADTSIEALARLKPAFHANGTVTAGNSSQMSDGAAACVIMAAEQARAIGAKPLARFVAFATAGCPPEIMGIGPVYAVPKVLRLAGLTLDQIEVIELNEAFAAQALSVIRELNMDPARVNVNGGAIALGHPLGCTGAKVTATLLRELERRKARYGMVTMCIGGGMGAAGIFERIGA